MPISTIYKKNTLTAKYMLVTPYMMIKIFASVNFLKQKYNPAVTTKNKYTEMNGTLYVHNRVMGHKCKFIRCSKSNIHSAPVRSVNHDQHSFIRSRKVHSVYRTREFDIL